MLPAGARADILRAVDGFVMSLPLGTSPGARAHMLRPLLPAVPKSCFRIMNRLRNTAGLAPCMT